MMSHPPRAPHYPGFSAVWGRSFQW